MRGLGRFQLIESLGTGAFGVVFRARDPMAPGQEFALKVLHKEGGRARARFQREISACVRLRHPGIVRVFESGEAGGKPYLLMELVRGQTLERLGSGQRRPSPARAAELARDAADAIAHAHHEGVLHRDLKPGNLLVDEAGRIRVLDFGLASLQDSQERLSVTGLALGTLAYMAPEQARGERVDERADVFGLGGVLFFLLTGRGPVEDVDDPWAALCDGPPPSPAAANPSVPPALDAIVRRALARDPAQRFAGAGEMADALRSFLAGGEEPRPRRSPAPVAGAALALGLVLLGGAYALRGSGASGPERPSPSPSPSPALAAASGTPPSAAREALAEALAEPEVDLERLIERFPAAPVGPALSALREAFLKARAGASAAEVVAAGQAAVSAAKQGDPALACYVAKAAARAAIARAHYRPALAWLEPWSEDPEAQVQLASLQLRLPDLQLKQAGLRRLQELGREGLSGWSLLAHATVLGQSPRGKVGRAARRAAITDPRCRDDARFLEALGLFREEEYQRAIERIEREPPRYGADVHELYLAAAAHCELEAWSEAERLATRARRLSEPNWVPTGIGLHARLLYQERRYREVVDLAAEVGAERAAGFWSLHADALDHLGRFDEAAGLARRFAERVDALVRRRKGNMILLSRLRRYAQIAPLQAVREPEVAAQVDAKLAPLSEPARAVLSEDFYLYAQGARLEVLLPLFERAAAAAPRDPELLLLRAEVEVERRENERALGTLERLRELRRPTPADLLLRGEILVRLNKVLAAQELLRELPQVGWAGRMGEAFVAYCTGQPARAMPAIDAVLAERPRQRQARWLKLIALLALQRRDEMTRLGDEILASERYMQLTTYYLLTEARLRIAYAQKDWKTLQSHLLAIDHILAVAPKSTGLALLGAHFVVLLKGRGEPGPSQWLVSARSWLAAAEEQGAKPEDLLLLRGALLAAEGAPPGEVHSYWKDLPDGTIAPEFRALYQHRYGR